MYDDLPNTFEWEDIPKNLLKIAECKFYRKNTDIIIPFGDYAKGLYYIISGKMTPVLYSNNGQEKSMGFAAGKTIFGEALLFTPAPNDVYMKFLEDTELLFISKEKFISILKTDFDVTLYILTSLSKKTMGLTKHNTEIIFYDSEKKVCLYFMNMIDRYGIKDGNVVKIDFKINQPLISNIIGVNRVTTAKAVKKLKEANLLELVNGYYIIKDLKCFKTYINNL